MPYNSVPLVYENVVVVGANTPPGTIGGIGNARAYDANYQKFSAAVDERMAKWRQQMTPFKNKPVVASLAGDVEVEEAADYLYQHGIPAYAYSTELPVEVLGAKYKWARGAGLL